MKGTDGSHTLVGVLSGPIRKLPDGKKVINSVGVSGKSQSNVINRKRLEKSSFFRIASMDRVHYEREGQGTNMFIVNLWRLH